LFSLCAKQWTPLSQSASSSNSRSWGQWRNPKN
jgi:hypothetical protein